ncbi:Ger(x)C family spore germination protein [Paenibacillus thalictri]|nr:Ger(x)C family spore germination protein [Paenibacillus thalictri]
MIFVLKLLLFIAGLLVLGGCWDNKDINHRSLPIIMGVSMQDDKFTVYLDIPQVTQSGQTIDIVSYTGATLNEIVDKISMNMESEVDLLHLKVIVVDKAYAEHGLKDSISSFMRSREISAKTIVVICDEDLGYFFKRLNVLSNREHTFLYDFFRKNAGWNPQIADTRTWQIFRSIDSYTRDVALPIVKSGKTTAIESMGSAIVKNGKMVGRLSPEETLIFNAFNGASSQGKIEVMDHATVKIVDNTLSHQTSFANGKASLTSTINLKVTILDTKGVVSTDLIGQELEELLTTRCNNMIKRLQKYEADILGIGQLFRNKLTREQLTRWRTDYYPSMNIDVKVQSIIQNMGNLKSSAS